MVIEGIEGSGKSSLCAALAQRLAADGCDVLTTREPGGVPLGDAVRSIFLDRSIAIDPLAEAFLVSAARAQHVADVILPALSSGRFVVCDRYVDSTLAYQGYGRGLSLPFLRELCATATGGLEAAVTLVLDIPVTVSRARTQSRARDADRLELEDDAFHERVRRGYLELAAEPSHRAIDATLGMEQVLERALAALQQWRVRRTP
ncbi:MAG: dTMP kinase [Candidatus Eremiobacteraeota bacterium]|nr:dTMP kinase [Candidatus Eremiobacteraeota bacterium]